MLLYTPQERKRVIRVQSHRPLDPSTPWRWSPMNMNVCVCVCVCGNECGVMRVTNVNCLSPHLVFVPAAAFSSCPSILTLVVLFLSLLSLLFLFVLVVPVALVVPGVPVVPVAPRSSS